MKLLVIADDLSGAAEIGGVAFQCGLKTEVQLSFQPGSGADLVVVDLNTRSMNRPDATATVSRFARQLREAGQIVPIFKKVDSVFRGHLVAEIGVLTGELGVERVLLFPANPGKGRKIIDGRYFIDGTPLHKTVFGQDPQHPITSPAVADLIKPDLPGFPHYHVSSRESIDRRQDAGREEGVGGAEKTGRGEGLPETGIITGDTADTDDLKRVMAMGNPARDLCCGGAEFFEVWLNRFGFYRPGGEGSGNGGDGAAKSDPGDRAVERSSGRRPHGKDSGPVSEERIPSVRDMLIINGSTVRNSQERTSVTEFGIPHLPLPGEWAGNRFLLDEEREQIWQHEVTEALVSARRAIVTIDHPLKSIDSQPQLFSKIFLTLINVLDHRGLLENLHLGITGGATASDILRGLGTSTLSVQREEGPGVVSLSIENNTSAVITIKPGSYPWPDTFLNRLKAKK